MDTIIIVNSVEILTSNWEEKQDTDSHFQEAGIHPEVQQRLEVESSERNPMPMLGDVSFECEETFEPGTLFSIKGNTRRFVVIFQLGKKCYANYQ
jgi:hypothetical protein